MCQTTVSNQAAALQNLMDKNINLTLMFTFIFYWGLQSKWLWLILFTITQGLLHSLFECWISYLWGRIPYFQTYAFIILFICSCNGPEESDIDIGLDNFGCHMLPAAQTLFPYQDWIAPVLPKSITELVRVCKVLSKE